MRPTRIKGYDMTKSINNEKKEVALDPDLKWKSESDKIVLYMDIMGFKEKVKKTEFTKIQNEFETLCKSWKRRTSPLHIGDHVRDIQFSDSIILVSDSADDDALNRIVIAGMVIMQEAMKMGFPINGAIAVGKFSFDKENNISFGQALVDAYLMQTSLFYYGIAVQPSAEDLVRKAKRAKQYISKMPIPLKGGYANHYQINWNLIGNKYDYCDRTSEVMKFLDAVEVGTTGNPRIYVENTRMIVSAIQKEFNPKIVRK